MTYITVEGDTITNTKDIAYHAAHALAEVKAKDIIILDFAGSSSFTDYFVIATGESPVHMKALANRVRKSMAEINSKIGHTEGKDGNAWVLLDYQQVIVHIFSKRARDYYAIDELWGDAKVIQFDEEGNEIQQHFPASDNGTFD